SFSSNNNISYFGELRIEETAGFMSNIDCLIISSEYETGPLVGIEAMAAGKLILSTDVGCMKGRLENTLNNFWFQLNDSSSFKTNLKAIKKLSYSEYCIIASGNRKRYLEKYSQNIISKSYQKAIKVNFYQGIFNNNELCE
ncbi:MAG: glycosyltransferase, partial [Nonlabens sp.]